MYLVIIMLIVVAAIIFTGVVRHQAATIEHLNHCLELGRRDWVALCKSSAELRKELEKWQHYHEELTRQNQENYDYAMVLADELQDHLLDEACQRKVRNINAREFKGRARRSRNG